MDKKVIHSFEDLEVYKLARELSRKVGKLIERLPRDEFQLKRPDAAGETFHDQ